jgi:hypothetical protein
MVKNKDTDYWDSLMSSEAARDYLLDKLWKARCSKGGKKAAEGMTQEQRIARARKAARVRWEKKDGLPKV